ncbi:MAG: SPASM domain-containing protein [Neisseriaceae bacterium]|nr:MAG: SPASM domain-containing protein [Neisseriaceae bacterium]
MKPSIYNKIVKYKEDYLVFNQVTGALLKASEKSTNKIKKIFEGKIEDEKLQKQLIELGYLIADKEDERVRLKKLYDEKSSNNLNKHLYITVTDRCNLGCNYCFEEKNQWIKMSPDTQETLKKFIYNFLTETETKHFGIGWYGGEPTLNIPAIENLSKYTKNLCEKLGISFYQMMISNGTTFTEAVTDKIIELNIDRVQITVDGFKEDHDLSRPYLKDLKIEEMNDAQKRQISKINSSLLLPIIGQEKHSRRSSYDDILSGLERYVKKGGKVSLRMNVDEETIGRIHNLLDDLLKRGLFEKNEKGGYVYAYAHPIYDAGGCSTTNEEGGCASCIVKTMKMEVFSNKIEKIKDWYNKNNIKYFDHSVEMKFTGETCTANKKYEYVVNPDGTLTKCTHHVGMQDKVIGNIKDLKTNPDEIICDENLKFSAFNPFKDEECYNCEVLPICMGGCKSNNKAGESKKYDAGCIPTKFSYEKDIIRLYEKKMSKEEVQIEFLGKHSH